MNLIVNEKQRNKSRRGVRQKHTREGTWVMSNRVHWNLMSLSVLNEENPSAVLPGVALHPTSRLRAATLAAALGLSSTVNIAGFCLPPRRIECSATSAAEEERVGILEQLFRAIPAGKGSHKPIKFGTSSPHSLVVARSPTDARLLSPTLPVVASSTCAAERRTATQAGR